MSIPLKSEVKTSVLPHSQAKLNLYRDYLTDYLPILGNSKFIDRINLFDIFCGTGIYDDGNLGSPLIAASQVVNYVQFFHKTGKTIKPIRLIINDFDNEKINNVSNTLDGLSLTNCEVETYNLDASEMFAVAANKINSYGRNERNLVFIDPYGYSKIQKSCLLKILNNQRSEIILFLPVAQMYRFANVAQTDFEANQYSPLRKFTLDFFEGNEKAIRGEFENVFDYIQELTKAFSFGNTYFTSSHYIQRDNANYYAVFFITHHIKGLEVFLKVKWKNDSLGKGFNQTNNSGNLFGDLLEEFDKTHTEYQLEKILKDLLKQRSSCTNIDLYEFTLRNQFLPEHCTEVIKRLKKEGKLIVQDIKGALVNPASFGFTYQLFKEKKVKYIFKMK